MKQQRFEMLGEIIHDNGLSRLVCLICGGELGLKIDYVTVFK